MTVSIIIPTYNEEKYISRCLDSLLNNDYDFKNVEIIIADGMSSDNTRIIIDEYSKKNKFIKYIDNEKRAQVFGLNAAIKVSTGELLIRCDAHCEYPENYIKELVKWHKKNIAVNAGGRFVTHSANNTLLSKSIALVMGNLFGVGISYRTKDGNVEKFVDTVPFGSWKRKLFDNIGEFDESFIRSQDLEHNIRIRKSGKKILYLPWLKIKYFARENYIKLWKMFFQYGFWKNKVNKKHKTLSSIRQIFPSLWLLGFIPLAVLPVFFRFLIPMPFIYFFLYYFIILVVSVIETVNVQENPFLIFFLIISFFITHVSYALGYIAGFFYFILFNRKNVPQRMKKYTR